MTTYLHKHLISFEKHTDKLYTHGVIDKEKKVSLLHTLDHMCHQTNKGIIVPVTARLYRYYKRYGALTLCDWFELMNVNKPAVKEYDLYSQIFVPICARSIPDCDKWEVVSWVSDIDFLCGSECQIRVKVNDQCYEFDGFIDTGTLNIWSRITKPDVTTPFARKYLKLTRGTYMFTLSKREIIDKIQSDASLFAELESKAYGVILSDFLKGSVRQMFRYINLLLLGSERNIRDAAYLYSIVAKDQSKEISRCIYRNLSFRQQVLLDNAKPVVIKSTVEEKMESPHIPQAVKDYIEEKQKELKTTEHTHKITTAINGLLNFPWEKKVPKPPSDPKQYLSDVRAKLDQVVYGHKSSKDAMIELVAKWISNPLSGGQVIGLCGQPGIGKTLMADAIAQALNLPLGLICLGGMEDPVDLIGHSYTYTNAQYGLIIRQMIKMGSWRSILFFDEVDKVSRRGTAREIHNILIHLTDPNTNHRFQDRFYSNIDFDLSGTLIIFSYNDSSQIHPILLDRIKEIKMHAFSETERVTIANEHLIPKIVSDIGLNSSITIQPNTLRWLIHTYTREAGIRSLKRLLEGIIMKLNVKRLCQDGPYANGEVDIVITQSMIKEYLNVPEKLRQLVHSEDKIGLVHGMYATNHGVGGILSIQVYENQYKDERLVITGNQRAVMVESIECALTAAMNSLSKAVRADASMRFTRGFHVHVPEAALPKDGPSAGVAFATAFVSLILEAPVNRLVAFSGEIDLMGNVRAVGGLEEKLWGAKQAGITCVVLSSENRDDYLQILQNHHDLNLKVKFVSRLKDIIIDPTIMKNTEKDDDIYL